MNFEKVPKLNVNEALAQIAIKESEAMGMGANHSEANDFSNIRTRLTQGDITPDEAVAEAYAIVESKQDYH